MSYWAINGDYYRKESGNVVLLTARKVSISKDDQAIIYKRDERDLTFIGFSRIAEVKHDKGVGSQFQFTLALDGLKPLKHELSVYDLVFSLKKIYRYENPLRHFRRQYVSLSKADYETILKGRIFWSRTAFGLFANAMTKNHYVQFIGESVPSLLYINDKTNRFVEGWSKIKEFILSHFVEASYLLTDIKGIAESLEKKSKVGLAYSTLQLSDDETGAIDSIKNQEEILSNFVHSLSLPKFGSQLFSALDEQIMSSLDVEKEFEDIFEGESWLIHPPVNI
jgi:hypothetical protein